MECLYTIEILTGIKQQILLEWFSAKIITLQNDISSFPHLYWFTFSSLTDNTTQQPTCVTAKSMLNATLAHYRYTLTRSRHHRYLSLRLHLVCTYLIHCDNWLSLNNYPYLLLHHKCYWGNGRLGRRKIQTELY